MWIGEYRERGVRRGQWLDGRGEWGRGSSFSALTRCETEIVVMKCQKKIGKKEHC